MTKSPSVQDVRDAAHRVWVLASELNLLRTRVFDGPIELRLQEGSKANGIAWRLYVSEVGGGGVTGNVLGLSNGYLGMTKQEAFDTLQTIWGVLLSVSDRDSVPRRDQSRRRNS